MDRQTKKTTPRTRGWTVIWYVIRKSQNDGPASAEMNRGQAYCSDRLSRRPRIRGDEPLYYAVLTDRNPAAPEARG